MALVFIPPAMRALTQGQAQVQAKGQRVRDVIDDLDRRFPGFAELLCDGDALRPGWNVVVKGSISALGLLERVAEEDEIHFLPAIGGG